MRAGAECPHLSTVVDYVGDVTSTRTYNGWTLEPGAIHYPRESTTERLGLPDEQLFITELHLLPAADDAVLRIDPAIASAHTVARAIAQVPFHPTAETIRAVAPGVEVVTGAWNVAFVSQQNGVIMLEAPVAPEYALAAMAYARERFHQRIKGVVTTSDSWPHIAGVRQAVAEHIPVYALDDNLPILRRLVSAPHTLSPDALQAAPAEADWRPISQTTRIGSGRNQLLIAPYRTATGERQMMAYLPSLRALYSSDLFAPDGKGGWFTPQYVDEALAAIEREHWSPLTVWGMHYAPLPFARLTAAALPIGT